MKKNIWILILGLLAVSVTVTPVIAETAAIKQSFSATATILGSPDPGKSWITKDGTQQTKKMGQIGFISGEIGGTPFDGEIALVVSLTLDETSMQGSAHGKFEISTTNGTIKGTLRVEIDLATIGIVGTFVGTQTTGNYGGKKIMGSLVSPEAGVLDFNGIILTPQP
ncbi:MAG: hypothetical protein NWE80_02580 [Candidatus Bathyarchaeota archaeon]|nr:hypothetical protein [Candidatus Bathyarchaeota archaeon]